MFKDIIIGQYVPGNSPLHKMNPPVKIIMTILYIVLLFILKIRFHMSYLRFIQ